MRGLPLGLMFVSAIGMLMPTLAAAQNPCGYAFSVTGETLYTDHCASCHGADGRGGGQLASSQKARPADLTEIKKRNRGEFPADRIVEIISSGGAIRGHETDQIMPIWGKVFHGECGPAFSRHAVVELKRYLESIQR